ncbi:NAD(P)-dependent alcohol dehydrogenase [Terrarubrum flagellatum]|uniref:zinc-dependent alcohol dehydrogenase family protein n=1 Tax=Terrirubrum flagellatum TaxID=2895980 RepID=UPI003144F342
MTVNRAWRLSAFGLEHLKLVDEAAPSPGPRELLVRVRATALNYKDRLIIEGTLVPGLSFPYTPASDAAGDVVAVGDAVTRFKIGDRVIGHMITDWIDGDAPAVLHTQTIGMSLRGVLSDYVLLREDASVAAPANLNAVEAATLPIAALTAWFALFEATRPRPAETILIQGTGGVSIFALQFAAATGLRAIVTSSSDEKLARASELGAWRTINYRKQPDWNSEARRLTDGRGVDHVLEMVGGENVRRSIDALGPDGRLSLIGLLGDVEFTLPIIPFMRNRLVVQGISVGHRRAFERMNAAIEKLKIKPVIDTIYPFADARKAFEHLARGAFGKIVIANDGK